MLLQHHQLAGGGEALAVADASWARPTQQMMTQPTLRIAPLEVVDSSGGGGSAGGRSVGSGVGSFGFGGGFTRGRSVVPSFFGGNLLGPSLVGASSAGVLAMPASVADGSDGARKRRRRENHEPTQEAASTVRPMNVCSAAKVSYAFPPLPQHVGQRVRGANSRLILAAPAAWC